MSTILRALQRLEGEKRGAGEKRGEGEKGADGQMEGLREGLVPRGEPEEPPGRPGWQIGLAAFLALLVLGVFAWWLIPTHEPGEPSASSPPVMATRPEPPADSLPRRESRAARRPEMVAARPDLRAEKPAAAPPPPPVVKPPPPSEQVAEALPPAPPVEEPARRSIEKPAAAPPRIAEPAPPPVAKPPPPPEKVAVAPPAPTIEKPASQPIEKPAVQLPPSTAKPSTAETAVRPPPPVAKPPPAEPAVQPPPAIAKPPPAEPVIQPLPPIAKPPAPKKPAPVRVVTVTPPKVKVKKTVWHPKPGRRVARIEVEGHEGTLVLHEGDAVGTLVVSEIQPSGVIFLHGGEKLHRKVGGGR